MKTVVTIVALAFVAIGISLTTMPSRHPTYQFGLTGNEWWAAQRQAAAQSADRSRHVN